MADLFMITLIWSFKVAIEKIIKDEKCRLAIVNQNSFVPGSKQLKLPKPQPYTQPHCIPEILILSD
ncbi:hypothetical protein LBU01_14000 [Lentilactobacillus buchneri]|nr:hypothetical protein LBU01_14000 [Lentilactobacillus buchneri]